MSALIISANVARRAAVAAQHLAGPLPAPAQMREAMLAVLRRLRCLQLDPIRAVERTQYLVLWSRLGNYDRELLHQLAYEERLLFEYWAHAASLVLTEDYPLHERMMRRYQRGEASSAWGKRVLAWVAENGAFKQAILDQLAENGPQLTNHFADGAKVPWHSGGWSSGRSVAYMLDHLWTTGEIMVSRRDGLKRWWDVAERVLPGDLPRGWSAEAVTRDGAQKALLALGVATEREIGRHFIEGRYVELGRVLADLVGEGVVVPVQVAGFEAPHYAHVASLPLLEALARGVWEPRTTLLSPFDNLIRDRERTERLWGFYYRIEIYVPAAKREYGYYVLPVLYGERLIGRISPRMDWRKGVLMIEGVYEEAGQRWDGEMRKGVEAAVGELALFLGAKEVRGWPW